MPSAAYETGVAAEEQSELVYVSRRKVPVVRSHQLWLALSLHVVSVSAAFALVRVAVRPDCNGAPKQPGVAYVWYVTMP